MTNTFLFFYNEDYLEFARTTSFSMLVVLQTTFVKASLHVNVMCIVIKRLCELRNKICSLSQALLKTQKNFFHQDNATCTSCMSVLAKAAIRTVDLSF